jgi:hypothetical protein
MYELKKIGKVFTSKFVGTGPSSHKKNLPGRGLTKVEKHCFTRIHANVSDRNDHTSCTDGNDTRKCCIENETLLIWDEMLEQKERNASELSHGAFITSRALKPRYSATVQSPHYVQGILISKDVICNREFLFTGYDAISGLHCITNPFQRSGSLLKFHIYCVI